MIDGSLKSILDDKKIKKALIKNSVEKLKGNKRLYIISDHSDNRKPYSKKLENLGKVRDLNGNITNGYTTLGSIILDENKKELTLSNISVQSNKEPNFITKKELKDYENNKIKDTKRVKEIEKLIEDNNYQNTNTMLYQHLKEQSQALKRSNPDISICHIHDRGCDSDEYLDFITNTLKDDVVIRAKKSRNSHQTTINPKTKKVVKVKLIDSVFKHSKVYHIDNLTLKGKHYQQVKCHMEWDTTTINNKEYSVVRVSLIKRDNKPIYKEPILLISSIKISNYLDAKEIYHIYLHRAKIEGVFRFLKDTLGWEEYQVRDWESIKNIIAICFFIGGYFYEIHSELTNNEVVIMICNLAKSKGKITHHFFLEGLKILLFVKYVEDFKKENNISDEMFKQMQLFAGIDYGV